MGALSFITLGALGLVFGLWAAAMFRALWGISRQTRRRLKETGGGYFACMGHALGLSRIRT